MKTASLILISYEETKTPVSSVMWQSLCNFLFVIQSSGAPVDRCRKSKRLLIKHGGLLCWRKEKVNTKHPYHPKISKWDGRRMDCYFGSNTGPWPNVVVSACVWNGSPGVSVRPPVTLRFPPVRRHVTSRLCSVTQEDLSKNVFLFKDSQLLSFLLRLAAVGVFVR